jgi:Acyl-CoA carboxylase epsilon subunit
MPMGAADSTSASRVRPLLTVVRGEPTAAELAALTVVISGLARRGSQQRQAPLRAYGPQWAAREQMMRPTLFAGPGAWRASARPH